MASAARLGRDGNVSRDHGFATACSGLPAVNLFSNALWSVLCGLWTLLCACGAAVRTRVAKGKSSHSPRTTGGSSLAAGWWTLPRGKEEGPSRCDANFQSLRWEGEHWWLSGAVWPDAPQGAVVLLPEVDSHQNSRPPTIVVA